MKTHAPNPILLNTLQRVMQPLARIMIDHGFRISSAVDLLKECYVRACLDHFQLEAKTLTDSRISLLTGLQRRDVKSLRALVENETVPPPSKGGGGMFERVLARWLDRQSSTLPRTARNGDASFEALVADVSRDLHHRTVLDELRRLGLIEFDAETDTVTLVAEAFVPSRSEDALLNYTGANLGDHAEAIADNLSAAPEPGPRFERAVHYNRLSPSSVEALEKLARARQTELLKELNHAASALQDADRARRDATMRFRCGAYIFSADDGKPGKTS
jgi:hypothetical protein